MTLDNWQVPGISTFSSGNPANVTFTTVDNADILGGGDLQGGGAPIVVTGDPNLPRGDRTLERWFDTSVFARPAPGQVGSGRKDVVRLPGVRGHARVDSVQFLSDLRAVSRTSGTAYA